LSEKEKVDLYQLIQDIQPDIVHVNTNTLTPQLVWITKKFPYIKTVLHHREEAQKFSANLQYAIAKSWKNIFIADEIIINMRKLGYTIENFDVVPNCSLKGTSEDYCSQKWEADSLNVVMGAQYSPRKGHFQFCLAAFLWCLNKVNRKKAITFYCYGFSSIQRSDKKDVLRKLKFFFDPKTMLIKLMQACFKDKIKLRSYNSSFKDFLNSEAHVLVRSATSNDPWGRDIIEGLSYGCIFAAYGKRSPFYLQSNSSVLLGDYKHVSDVYKLVEFFDTLDHPSVMSPKCETYSNATFMLSSERYDLDMKRVFNHD
jgi:hypothetical protein